MGNACATKLDGVENALKVYKQGMKKVCGKGKPILSVDELRAGHERCRAKALHVFDAKKMDGAELVAQFAEKLEADIQEAFKSFELINDNKKKMAETTNLAAVNSSMKVYEQGMEKICVGDEPSLSVLEFYVGHKRSRAKAMDAFGAKKMGGPELEAQFVEKLENAIQEAFESFALIYNNKKKTTEPPDSVAVGLAKTVYKLGMEKLGDGDKDKDFVAELRAGHERCRDAAVRFFEDIKEVDGPELTAAQFAEKLDMDFQLILECLGVQISKWTFFNL